MEFAKLCQECTKQGGCAVEMLGHRVTRGGCISGEHGLHDLAVLLVRVHDIAWQQGNCVEKIVDPDARVGDR
jgi:hypothetical protein